MILSFSTKINGKPTYFPEKIWQGFIEMNISDTVARYVWLQGTPNPKDDDRFKIGRKFRPKIHTIREDKKGRWKPGVLIDFFINARQKNMFRFAPKLPVVSTQDIFMTHRCGILEITIAKADSYMGGDDFYLNRSRIKFLAEKDGFDSEDDFKKYFVDRINENGKATGNYWFSGKIIHWTEFEYY